MLKINSTNTTEFQAVILSGSGSRLYPFTEDIPKALLPIANKPMVYYPLRWLEEAKVNDIIILTFPHFRQSINDYITKVYEWNEESQTKVQTIEVPTGCGTADALRFIKNKLKRDFIVMSCDFISDTRPHALLDTHRVLDPTLSALFYDGMQLRAGTDRSNMKDDESIEYVGVEHQTSRLLVCSSENDLDDSLDLKYSLLERFPRLRLYTNLKDAHVYVFKKWVLDLIVKKTTISSIRLDLIPLLLSYQYRAELLKREGIHAMMGTSTDALSQAYSMSTHGNKNQNQIVCMAVISRDGLSTRANTRWAFGEINRQWIKNFNVKIASSAEINPKTQVGSDSMVGEGTKMDERCSVKKSVIGSHCNIGKNVKISNSIIMDYVTIEDQVNLSGCIVCNNAVLQTGANLKDCEVGSKFIVAKQVSAKNECFVDYIES